MTAPHFLDASTTAWLACPRSVGGGDADALRLLPAFCAPARATAAAATTTTTTTTTTTATTALNRPAGAVAAMEHVRQTLERHAANWPVAEACGALASAQAIFRDSRRAARMRSAAQRRAAVSSGYDDYDDDGGGDDASAYDDGEGDAMENNVGAGRRGSNAALWASVVELRDSVRGLVLQQAARRDAGGGAVVDTVALRQACLQMLQTVQQRCPARMHDVGDYLRAVAPASLVAEPGDAGYFVFDAGAIQDEATLADIYLRMHAVIGEHAREQAAVLSAFARHAIAAR